MTDPVAPVPYSSLNDPVAGGSLHGVVDAPAATPYSSVNDPGVGVQQQQAEPNFLERSMRTILSIPDEILHPTPAGPADAAPNAATSAYAGFGHGVRNAIIDKPAEWLAGAFGGKDAADQVRAQNEAAKTQAATDYADHPTAFNAGHIAGETAGSSAVLVPGMGLVGSGLRLGGAALGGATGAGLEGTGAVLSGTAGADTTGIPGVALRFAARAPQGAVGGAAGSALSGDDIAGGAATGAVLGPVLGLPFEGAVNLYRAFSGLRTPPITGTNLVPDVMRSNADNAAILQSRGVPVATTQVSGDPTLQTANRAPFAQGTRLTDQLQSFRSAAMQDLGAPGGETVATPGVLRANADRIGLDFDNTIGAVNSIPAGNTLNAELGQMRGAIPTTLTGQEQQQIVNGINTVQNAFATGRGSITGAGYQDLTRRGTGALEPLVNSDNPTVRAFGLQLRDAIDQRLQAVLPQAQQDTLAAARGQYRTLKTLELATRDAPNGDFTPAQLYGAVKDQSDLFDPGNTGFSYGGGGRLGQLARAGHAVITPGLSGDTGAAPNVGATAAAKTGGFTVPSLAGAAATYLLGAGLGPAALAGGAGLLGTYGLGRGVGALNWASGPVRNAIELAQRGTNPSAPNLASSVQTLIQAIRAYQQPPASQ
jgi:hypothetical protein